MRAESKSDLPIFPVPTTGPSIKHVLKMGKPVGKGTRERNLLISRELEFSNAIN